MLLLFTFDEPSSGSRTTEKRPRPRSFTSPISSEATWETSFESRHASTKRSFIQTSSSSCSSPYTVRVAAESLRIGSSLRIRLTRPANRDNKRPRSRSTFPACSASVTFVPRRPSVLDVPSLEVVLQLVFSAVEVPPRTSMPLGEVRERLEVPHSLRPDVLHLRRERLLPERILPDRAAREEPGGPATARDLDESPEHVEVGPGAQHDPGHLRRVAQAVAVLPEILGVRGHLRVAREFRLQHVDAQRTEGLRRPDDRVGLVVGERLLALVDRIRHRLAHEREVETTALVRDRLDDFYLVVHDLAWGGRIEEEKELPPAGAEPPHLLHAPAVKERREPPVPFLLVSGLLQSDEKARAARQGEPIDRWRHPVLRIEEIAARVGGESLRDSELHRLHLRMRRGLRILRMEHLLKAPPLVHRDHREPPRVVRNLLEAAELADRNSHSCHPDGSQRGDAVLTFAAAIAGDQVSRQTPSRNPRKRLYGICSLLDVSLVPESQPFHGVPPSVCSGRPTSSMSCDSTHA